MLLNAHADNSLPLRRVARPVAKERHALRQRLSRSVPLLSGFGHSSYVVDMTLDGQEVPLLIDTGSSLLAVVSAGCRTDNGGAACPGVHFHPAGEPVSCDTLPGCCGGGHACVGSIAYLDGTAAMGPIYGASARLDNISSRVFLAAIEKTHGHFSTTAAAGILGLGLVPHGPIPDYLSSLDVVSQSVGLCLGDEGGKMSVGAVDESAIVSPVRYVEVVAPHRAWQVAGGSIAIVSSVGGAAVNASVSLTGLRIIVDSGTTLLLLPADRVSALKQRLQALCVTRPELLDFLCGPESIFSTPEGHCRVFDGAVLEQLPPIEITLPAADGGAPVQLAVPGKHYIRYEQQSSGRLCGIFGIVSMPTAPPDLVLLGDVVLRSVYAHFDRSRQPARIGFAPSVNCTPVPARSGGRREPLLVAGVVLGSLAVGVLIFLGFVWWDRRRRRGGAVAAADNGLSARDAIPHRKLPAFDVDEL